MTVRFQRLIIILISLIFLAGAVILILYNSKNNLIFFFTPTELINLQTYQPGGGFKTWHCERAGITQQTRCLVFMTYLNDVEDGGTEFEYQKMTAPAKKGLTIIWPSDWTHTHKGQISHTYKKYIATGWLNYTA